MYNIKKQKLSEFQDIGIGSVKNRKKLYLIIFLLALMQLPVAKHVYGVTADFTVSNRFPQVGQVVTFTDESEPIWPANIVKWEWDFGNGYTLSGNTGIIRWPQLFYSTEGYYTVSLKVTTDFGRTDTETKTNYILVHKAVTAGAIGTDQNICIGATPSALTSITAGTGSGDITYEWQTNASGTYVTISGATSAGYQPPALTATTSYRRRTVSTFYGYTYYSDYTAPVTISTIPKPIAGTISPASAVVCNGDFITLTLSDYTGTIQWQEYIRGWWYDIAGANASTYTTPALTNIAYYRVIVKNGDCYNQVISNEVQITIPMQPTGAVISGFPVIDNTSATINWIRGGGSGVIVVADVNYYLYWEDTPVQPTNGTLYTANSAFGYGSMVGPSWSGSYVVYNGTGTSVTVTNLSPGTPYRFTVYEYYSPSYCYKNPGNSANIVTTCTCGVPQVTLGDFSNTSQNSTTVNWTMDNQNPTMELVVGRLSSTPAVEPVNGFQYTAYSNFASDPNPIGQIGPGNYAVFSGMSNHVTVTGLQPNTSYTFTVYAWDSSNGGTCYKIPGASASVTTDCVPPEDQAAIKAYSGNTSGTGLNVNWNRGSGNGVVVVARLASTGAINPVSGNTYNANPVFGSGDITGTGNYVVYNGTGTSVYVSGLTKNTNYIFTVYEYNTVATCYKTPGSYSSVITPLYCIPTLNIVGCGISEVKFGDFDNDNNYLPPYSDYTASFTTDVNQGSTQELSVWVYTGSDVYYHYTSYQKAWIDWNQDNEFNNTPGDDTGMGEEYDLGNVYNLNDALSNKCPLKIKVPLGAKLGTTRMRISSTRGAYTTPCASSGAGEFEDYSVNVLPCEAIVVSGHPSLATQTLCVSENATPLSVVATGTGLTYQWYRNSIASNSGGNPITGATSANYTPTTTSQGTLYYYCVVGGACSQPLTSNVSGAVIVTAPPVAGTISGINLVYKGYLTKLTLSENADAGGAWSSSDPNVATIDASGMVSGINAGSATIYYTVAGTGGCSNAIAEFSLTVSEPTFFCFGAAESVYEVNDPNNDMAPENAVGFPDFNYAAIGQDEYIALDLTGGILSLGNTVTITWSRWEGEALAPDAYLYESKDGINWQFIKWINVVNSTFVEEEVTVQNSTRYLKIENPTSHWLYVKSVTFNYPCSGCLNGTLSLTSNNKDQIICPNSAISNIIYEVGGGATGATVSGLPSGLGGTYSNGHFIISGLAAAFEFGTFNFTVSTTGTQTGCKNATATGTITIISVPEAYFEEPSSNKEICAGENAEFYLAGTANAMVEFSLDGGAETGTEILDGSGSAKIIIPGVRENQEMSLIRVYLGSCSKTLDEKATVIVNPIPEISILGNTMFEVDEKITLSPSSGGTWTSSDPDVATVNNEGIVTGITPGTATFTFTDNLNDCSATTEKVTVITDVCLGYAVDFHNEYGYVDFPENALGIPDGVMASIYWELSSLILDLTLENYAIGSPVNVIMSASENGDHLVNIYESSDPYRIQWTHVFTGNLSSTESTNVSINISDDTRFIKIENNNPEVWINVDGVSYNYPCPGCSNGKLILSSGNNYQTVPKGTVLDNIVYTVDGGVTDVEVSGLPAGVTGNYNGEIFTISGTPTADAGLYPYTVSTIGAISPCTNASVFGEITVNPSQDLIPPDVKCQDVTVYLDENGSGTITAEEVDNGSTDESGIKSMSLSQTDFDCANLGSNTVALTVTDNYDNVSTCQATVTVVDNIPPVVETAPIEVTVNCANQIFYLPEYIATDNCGSGPIYGESLGHVDNPSPLTCEGTRVYTVRYTDASGNFTDWNYTYHVVVDDFSLPDDGTGTVECGSDATAEQVYPPMAYSSDCEGRGAHRIVPTGPVTNKENTDTFDGCGGTISYTWTYTDCSGRYSKDWTYTYTVVDETKPEIVCKNLTVNLDADGKAEIVLDDILASASDNCNGELTIDFTPKMFDCSNVALNNIVTVTAFDCAGNNTTCEALVTVNDVTPPKAICTDKLTVYIDEYGSATVTEEQIDNQSYDNCEIVFMDVSPNIFDCTNLGDNIVTLTVTDASKLTSSCQTTVRVEDKIPPTFTPPANTTVYRDASCEYDASPSITGDVTDEADNCGVGEANYSDYIEYTPEQQCFMVIERTWSLMDNAGNKAVDQVQYIYVRDNIPPVIQQTAKALDRTVECSDPRDLDRVLEYVIPTAVDICANAEELRPKLKSDNTTADPECPNGYYRTRTWYFDDGCGNRTEDYVQVIHVVDTEAPVLKDPLVTSASLDISGQNECMSTAVQWNASTLEALVAAIYNDNCDAEVSATLTGAAVPGINNSDCSWSFTYTFTVADNCGNDVNCTVTRSGGDTEDPRWAQTMPDNTTVECDEVPPVPTITATDNCDTNLDVWFSEERAEGACLNSYMLTRKWTATDNCLRSITHTQVIIVKDTEAPILVDEKFTSTSLDITGVNECLDVAEDWSAAQMEALVADLYTDNCDTEVSATLNGTAVPGTNNSDCSWSFTYTFTVADNCGNDVNCTVTRSGGDTESPEAICKNIVVSLDENGNATISEDAVNNESTDNCTSLLTFDTDITTFDCSNVGDNPVVLTVTDNCYLSSTCNTTVKVEDHISPEIFCVTGSPLTRDVDENMIYYTVSGAEFDATASDACGIASFSYKINNGPASAVSTMDGVQLALGENTVEWTAVDANNNVSTCTIIVNVTKRSTTLSYTGDLYQQYSDETILKAVLKDEYDNPVEGKTIRFTIGSQSATGITGDDGMAATTMVLTQSPVPFYTVLAEFAGDNFCMPSSDEEAFNIAQEIALTEYTGQEFVGEQNPDVSNTPLILSATLTDEADVYRGDIRNARVQFYDVNSLQTLSDWLEPGLVVPADVTQGLVTHIWNAPVPTSGYNTFTIGVKVGTQNPEGNGYYIGSDKAVVNVYRTDLYEFISGGGHIIPMDSKGDYASDPSRKVNFGFNVKWNKTMKRLQGNLNLVFRIGADTYQVKTNAMTTLSINSINPCSQEAYFSSKANLTRITSPEYTEEIKGNLDIQVTMTNNTSPGAVSTIGFTVYDGNTLLYSSNWPVNQTEELPIAGGNIIVHNGIECVTSNEVDVILYSSRNPSFIGEEVIFEAVVIPKGNSLVPQGKIVFKDGTSVLGTVTMAEGKASLILDDLNEGDHPLTAEYIPSDDYESAISNTVTQQVKGAVLELISDNNPSNEGETVKFTATVIGPPGGATPTGTISFADDGKELGKLSLVSGMASFEATDLKAGSHIITVEYSGDANYLNLKKEMEQLVQSNVIIQLLSSKNPEQVNKEVIFTATVFSSGIPLEGANVDFYINGEKVTTKSTDNDGIAMAEKNFPVTGTYLVESRYNGQMASLSQVIKNKVKAAEIATVVEPELQFADLKVYPNPFSEKLRFEFVSPEAADVHIELYDMTGRLVTTIFEQPIEGGTWYEAEFRPEVIISAVYFYRVSMGKGIYNGKVIFKKE